VEKITPNLKENYYFFVVTRVSIYYLYDKKKKMEREKERVKFLFFTLD